MSVIDQLKQQYKDRTTEDLLGLINPPEYQCSNIDSVLDAISTIAKAIKKHERMDEDELRDAMNDVEYQISGLDKDIESIRSKIEDVRAWGQEWKDLFKYHVNSGHIKIEELNIKEEVA